MAKLTSLHAGPDRPLPRLFVPDGLSPGAEVRLPERAARHIAVLRLRQDDEVSLFNGNGGQYRAVLSSLGRDRSLARVVEFQPVERESPLTLNLAQCISSGDRMDTTLQKATELGVSCIIPLASERSVVRLSAERAERRLEHWRSVVIAACEQCGRNRVPEVQAVGELLPWLATSAPGMRMWLDPGAAQNAGDLKTTAPSSITLLVGAEGGFAPHERSAIERSGFLPIRLGPRTLRTETAPLAALAALQTLWGDFR